MKLSMRAGCVVAALVVVSRVAGVEGAVLAVQGTSNIYGSGHLVMPGGGTTPPSVSFGAGPGKTVVFSSVTGAVDFGGGRGMNGPDGFSISSTGGVLATGGLAGIYGRQGAPLVGVFLDGTEPVDPPPADLDFSPGEIGTSFATLSPLVRQVFFIGDGLTGTGSGSQQVFNIPATATRMFLGLADNIGGIAAPGHYGNNTGSFVATFVIPEPGVATPLAGAVIAALARRRLRE